MAGSGLTEPPIWIVYNLYIIIYTYIIVYVTAFPAHGGATARSSAVKAGKSLAPIHATR
jgi:hypothetical protein